MLHQMSQAADASYLAEFQKVRDILAQESALRAKLEQLANQSDHERQTQADRHSMQMVGADLLWQGWVSRTRRQLNIELAQVMARKLAVMDKVRRAFGRQQAVKSVIAKDGAERRKRRNKRFESDLIHRLECARKGF